MSRPSTFRPLAEVPVDVGLGSVYEHGWQSWSPTTAYPVTGSGGRAVRPVLQTMSYRPGRPGPVSGFQGEGLLAVDPGTGEPVRVYAARDGLVEVPSIRAELVGGRVVVGADDPGGVEETLVAGPVQAALGAWADRFAIRAAVPRLRRAPTVWCSWYHYFTEVTEADVLENLEAVATYELPVDVVQIDDGWQAEIGDWLTLSARFTSLAELVGRIRDAGRRAGLWIAPFLAGAQRAGPRPPGLAGGGDRRRPQLGPGPLRARRDLPGRRGIPAVAPCRRGAGLLSWCGPAWDGMVWSPTAVRRPGPRSATRSRRRRRGSTSWSRPGLWP